MRPRGAARAVVVGLLTGVMAPGRLARARLRRRSRRVLVNAGTRADRDAFAELLIDCEEGQTLRAVLVGMLREADGSR
jgi:hypothetical protein